MLLTCGLPRDAACMVRPACAGRLVAGSGVGL